MWARARTAVVTLVALIGAVLASLVWTVLPAPAPADAPAAEFSAGRAISHLREIARRPHRMGSPEHARVRAYLVEQLRALGLEPEVQEAVVAVTHYRPARFAVVHNVVARRRGAGCAGCDKALLLMAHYDSRSMTPGASDDGFGVVTLLETARALRDGGGAPPASDVIFLFTDGEEEGLLGAHAFAEGHRFAADVGLALNFDTRGDAGPALMFQTGDDNGALVGALGRAVALPAANSLSQAIYRRMPNDTDLSVLLPRTPSLNFANIGGFERYHAPTDTVDNASAGTLQHHGAQALALTRAFAARALPLPREPDAVYFDAGPIFVHYPGSWDVPLALAAAALVLALVAFGHRAGACRAPFAALGLLAAIGLTAAAGVVVALLWALAERLHPDYRLLNAASPALKGLYLASFLAVAVAVVLGGQALLLRRLRAAELFAGAAALFAALALLAGKALPGAAFLFTWPVLAALPAAALLLRGRFTTAAAILASVPPLVIVAPFVPQLFTAFGPAASPFVAGLAALLATFAAPAAELLIRPRPRVAPLAAAGVGAALFLAASLHAPFDEGHPRPDTLLCAVDGDTGRAFWLTPDPEMPPWAGIAGATPGPAPLPFPLGAAVLSAPAGSVSEPGPEITWLDGAPGGALRARVVPPAGAELLSVRATGVRSARVAGKAVPLQEGMLSFLFYAPPAEGVEIELVPTPNAPVAVKVASQRAGFPAGATPAPGPRPADRMARPGMMPPSDALLESDLTIVARSSRR